MTQPQDRKELVITIRIDPWTAFILLGCVVALAGALS